MVFCFVQNFFFGHHESSNIKFFCRAKREFFLLIKKNAPLYHFYDINIYYKKKKISVLGPHLRLIEN